MKGVAKMGGGGLALLEELGEKLQHPPPGIIKRLWIIFLGIP